MAIVPENSLSATSVNQLSGNDVSIHHAHFQLHCCRYNESAIQTASGQILKLIGEIKTSYLVHILDITINNATIPSVWKKAIVVPIYKGGDCSLVSNYRPLS
jgi:hypothetical protein